jgi:hypothetical protein
MSEQAALEFHDSTFGEATQEDDGVVVHLAPAYVHRSSGRPGIDPGTGWSQSVTIRVKGAVLSPESRFAPARLSEGSLEVGACRYENVVPLPLSLREGQARLSLLPVGGPEFVLRGSAVEVLPQGEATFIEHT